MADIEAVRLPSGWACVAREQVGSTNEDALSADLSGPTWFVGGEQIVGRGRRGRSWSSPVGNLHATAALTDPCNPQSMPEIPFVMAVAACNAVRQVGAQARIKWPNDILVDGAKVAGLLAESTANGRDLRVACGFGMNAKHAPDAALYETAALGVCRSDLFEALANCFGEELSRWRNDGFAHLRSRWLQRAQGIGEPMVARLPGPNGGTDERRGTFEALEADGALRLRLDDGRCESISAGDIFFQPV